MTRSSLEQSLGLLPRSAGSSASTGVRPAAGPGWFESSWDLRRGLEVRESGEPDARLHTWIEDFLGAQPGAPVSAAAGASLSAR